MRFFVFCIWMLSYGLPILPAGMLLTCKAALVEIPTEIVVLTIIPLFLYIILHSIQNRQQFNFIRANFFLSLPTTVLLLLINVQYDFIKYASAGTVFSCVLVLLFWWKYPSRKAGFF